jgi:hypothetical protein
MDLLKMISELQAEKQRLDEAIQALERLSAGKLRRRGRPPGWLKSMLEAHGEKTEQSRNSDASNSEE